MIVTLLWGPFCMSCHVFLVSPLYISVHLEVHEKSFVNDGHQCDGGNNAQQRGYFNKIFMGFALVTVKTPYLRSLTKVFHSSSTQIM